MDIVRMGGVALGGDSFRRDSVEQWSRVGKARLTARQCTASPSGPRPPERWGRCSSRCPHWEDPPSLWTLAQAPGPGKSS
eukprot:scaffold9439_cov118-Isochrysis_galbana.AAC.2